ncbi:MAG: HAD-IIIA family hydrolase [Nitrospiraceae bacterium]|nr:HAD-IIIA family hydrolase [Nitrospiraceae bacterium]
MNVAVFLDRDNTLIEDRDGYIHEPSRVKLLPTVGEGLRLLKQSGFLLIVISNQSGINRGYFEESDFHAVNDRLNHLLLKYDVQIDDFFFCPCRPDENCHCRKPSTGMIVEAAKKWHIDVGRSYVIGDKDTDVELGRNAGCRESLRVGVLPFLRFIDAALFVVENYEENLDSNR